MAEAGARFETYVRGAMHLAHVLVVGIGAVVWLTVVWVVVGIVASLFGMGEIVTRPIRRR